MSGHFTPRALYPKKCPRNVLNRRLGGHQTRYGRLGEEKSLIPVGNKITIPRASSPSPNRCTDQALRFTLYSFNDAASNSHYIVSNGIVITVLIAKGVERRKNGVIYTIGLASASRASGQQKNPVTQPGQNLKI